MIMSRKLISSGTRWTKRELKIAKDTSLSIKEKLSLLPTRTEDALYWQMNKHNFTRHKGNNRKIEPISTVKPIKSTTLKVNGVSINITSNIKDITVDETGILITT